MASYDSPAQGVVSEYANRVKLQKMQAAQFEEYVREVVVPADQQAEKTEDLSRTDYQDARGLFDLASSDKLTLEEQREALIQEKKRKIAQIEEQIDTLKRQGGANSEAQILTLRSKIPLINAEYNGRLIALDFNINLTKKNFDLNRNTLAEKRTIFQRDRFAHIGTSNDVWSGFMDASRRWNQVASMTRYQGFLQAQADIIDERNNNGQTWLG